jgi:hypothetical protein
MRVMSAPLSAIGYRQSVTLSVRPSGSLTKSR